MNQEIINDFREKLESGFAKLNDIGILAKGCVACCSTCSTDLLYRELQKLIEENDKWKGYCYWHEQNENEINNEGIVYLGFSGFTEELDRYVALSIIRILKEENLLVEWNGNINTKILVGYMENKDFNNAKKDLYKRMEN